MIKVTYRINGAIQHRFYSSKSNAKRGIKRLRKQYGSAVDTYWLMEVYS